MIKDFKNNYNNKNIAWPTVFTLLLYPIFVISGVVYAISIEGWHLSPWIWAILFYFLTVMAISGGYHRLFSHRAFTAKSWVKLMYLLWGAASLETSALEWSRKHRRHHKDVDTEDDPYNINEGFWYAHMGWMFLKEDPKYVSYPKDLLNDRLVMWQYKWYVPIMIFMGILLPLLIGFLYELPLSFLFIVAGLRIFIVHQVTYFINSFAHTFGTRPYCKVNTARDSLILSIMACGEGYHNFHHKFQADYRNGPMWYNWDPSKWFIYLLKLMGGASKLRKTSNYEILKAKLNADQTSIESKFSMISPEKLEEIKASFKEVLSIKNIELKKIDPQVLKTIAMKVQESQKKLNELKAQYHEKKRVWKKEQREKLMVLKANLKIAEVELKASVLEWKAYVKSLNLHYESLQAI